MRQAILLLNFGGPESLVEIKPFLFRLFSAPEILTGIPAFFRPLIAFFISLLRLKKAKKIYRQINGKSPQNFYTRKQAQALDQALAQSPAYHYPSPIRIASANRTTEPSIRHTLQQLKQKNIEKLILLPLFPQYSTTTTGSCFNEVDRQLIKLKWYPQIIKIDSWYQNEDYINLVVQTIEEQIICIQANNNENDQNEDLPAHILFSAHSLPMKTVEKGDPYPTQINNFVSTLTKRIQSKYPQQFTYSLAYQSRLGPLKWLEPYLSDEIQRLATVGIKQLIMVPISFVSDHIETLYELDQVYARLSSDCGILHYHRCRTFNDDIAFTKVLQSITKSKIKYNKV